MTTRFANSYAASGKRTAILTIFGTLAAATALAQVPKPVFPLPPQTVSTVPPSGDVNPYGVAIVPAGFPTTGVLQTNDILVSNFNNAQNLQGTGSTIVRVDVHGQPSLFYQGPNGLGLTAALGVLRAGIVLVGSLPTVDGTSATIRPTSLLALDRNGHLLGTLATSTQVQGPWGMAIHDEGSTAVVYISNVLSGTVERFNLNVTAGSVSIASITTIGSGFNHRPDPAALVLGPSGLLFVPGSDTLYVASSTDNAVYAIGSASQRTATAGTGTLVYQDFTHLHGPLQMAALPNGDFIVANSDGSNVNPTLPSELVEFTPSGQFVSQFSLDPNNGGAFGVAAQNIGNGAAVRIAAVDDNQNSITTWTILP